MKLKVGSVVRATAGRDSGSLFAVTAVDGSFCSIADGKSRKLAHPKRKNRRHIALTSSVINIEEITDKRLRVLLRELREAE